MDREANYVAVGVFVLLVLFMGIGFVLWYSNAANGEAATRYEIYFEGSVGGLSEGSAVRYLGVAVGRVVKIGIDPRDPGRVGALHGHDEGAPVKEDTVARLSLQGVTGLLTINLEPREPGSIPPPRIESLKFPVIPSEQSRFDVLITSLPDVTAKAGESLNRINAMLSDENIAAVTKSFEYTEDATSDPADDDQRGARDVPRASGRVRRDLGCGARPSRFRGPGRRGHQGRRDAPARGCRHHCRDGCALRPYRGGERKRQCGPLRRTRASRSSSSSCAKPAPRCAAWTR